MSAHTPGPWHTDGLAVVGPSEELEICVCTADEDIYRVEASANARLIATAPELLAALQELFDAENLGTEDELQEAMEAARLAIQAATNPTP